MALFLGNIIKYPTFEPEDLHVRNQGIKGNIIESRIFPAYITTVRVLFSITLKIYVQSFDV